LIRFTPYAETRIEERSLARKLVEDIATDPDQLLNEGNRQVAQRRYTDATRSREYLVRVIYEEVGDDKLIITAYQTSKVEKYWRSDEDSV